MRAADCSVCVCVMFRNGRPRCDVAGSCVEARRRATGVCVCVCGPLSGRDGVIYDGRRRCRRLVAVVVTGGGVGVVGRGEPSNEETRNKKNENATRQCGQDVGR